MTRALVAVCGDSRCGDIVFGRGVDADICIVPGLCRQPNLIRDLVPTGALVLALCSASYSLSEIQREARRAGIDPLGMEIVHLDEAAGDRDRLAVMLAGAVARASSFPGSDPDQAKLSFPGAVSRRSLLRFSLPEYHATPSIDNAACVALRGCRSCVEVCPRRAFTVAGNRVTHDRSVCEPCGQCVTACPTGAIQDPVVTSAAIAAQVRALVDGRTGPRGRRGIVFRCRRSTRVETMPGWYPLTVPCTSMVTEAWLLAPLLLGASAVAVRPCADSGCSLTGHDVVSPRVAWCADLIANAGGESDRVTTDPVEPPSRAPLPEADIDDPFAPTAAGGVLLAVVEHAGGDAAFVHGGGPLGLIEVDAEACTGCGTCAASCPTAALVTTAIDGRTQLSFDATRCVACDTCVKRCPEAASGAITLTRATDVRSLRSGKTVVWSGEVTRCARCGKQIAPTALLARFAARLGDDRLVDALSTKCVECRGTW